MFQALRIKEELMVLKTVSFRIGGWLKRSFTVVVACLVTVQVCAGMALSTLHSFDGPNGANPRGTLLQATDGYLYGTTQTGGTNGVATGGDGTIYRISPAGEFQILASLLGTSGSAPQSPLIQAHDGVLYGTAAEGGVENLGAVFKWSPDGQYSTVLLFTGDQGGMPNGLMQSPSGDLYGTLYFASSNSVAGGAYGGIFRLTTNGVFTAMATFNGVNGANPRAGLLLGADGNFYGTTFKGGTTGGWGTVFKMTPAGAITTLVSFNGTNGAAPLSPLIQTEDGALYGTTSAGGIGFNGIPYTGFGTVFRIAADGTFSTVAFFGGTNGSYLATGALVKASDGALYGTTQRGGTYQAGTVYRISSAGVLSTLVSFSPLDGSEPASGLVQASDGNLYVVTATGGKYDRGTVCQIRLLAERPILSIRQAEAGFADLCWNSTPNGRYQLQSTDALQPTQWVNVGEPITATGPNWCVKVPKSAEKCFFYRVEVIP